MLFKTKLPYQLQKDRRIFLTADQHYSHRKIVKYSNRPFPDIETHDKQLASNHNELVRPTDCVIHIGDFCFRDAYGLIRLMRELNGHHYLMDGSHDRALEEVLDDGGFPEDCNVTVLPKLFEFKYAGHKITLCHYAMIRYWASHHNALHFYGHSHGHYEHPGKAIDVGVDCHNYYPVLIEDAIKKVLAITKKI